MALDGGSRGRGDAPARGGGHLPLREGRPGVHGDDHGRRVPLPAAAAGGVVPGKRARAHRRRPRARHGAARLQGGRGSGPDGRARPLPAGHELGQRPRARLPVGGGHARPPGRGEAAPGERGGAADGDRGGGGEGDPGRAPRGVRRRDRRPAGSARAPQRAPADVLQRRDRRDRAGGGDRGRGPARRPGRADARHAGGRGGRETPALPQAAGVLPGPGDPARGDGGQPGQPGSPARPARRPGAPPPGDRSHPLPCSTRRGG